MSNNKHTKGHWETTRHPLKDGFTAEVRLSDGNKKLIAKVRGDNYANLIAAAPELLRELKSAIFYIETYGGQVTESFSAGGNLSYIKSIIAKAEGK